MRIVIKVGTSTLAHSTGRLNIRHVEQLCKILSDLKNAGHEIIFVSSGAIGMGVGKLSLSKRPSDIPGKQAAAAVGQCELMYVYDKLFSEYNHIIAQILITGEDFHNESRHTNFKNTMKRLLDLNVMPIINENDTVSTVEIGVGDNDTLAAMVACSIQADLLVLLSDIDGLFTSDPHRDENAKLISDVYEIDEYIRGISGTSASNLGTGGMQTKMNAAEMCINNGIDMIIANGQYPEKLYNIMEGKSFGTTFHGKTK